MKTLVLSALALSLVGVAGCGGSRHRCNGYNYQCPGTYTPTPGQPPVSDPNTFLIDAGAAIELPQATLGITTNGRDWVLAWQGDAYPRQFHGAITCAVGCVITGARYDNPGPGDTAVVTAQNQLQFTGYTDAIAPQNLVFSATGQPMTFDLYIENTPAVGRVVFPSQGYLATTDAMPFSLISSNATGFAKKIDRAPQFVPKPPEDGQAEHIITVSAPTPKTEAGTQEQKSGAAQ
jgi:hypothetical protein